MDINDYLARFYGLPYKKVSLSNLTALQQLHMQHVPFENLDVIRRVPIYLNLPNFYEKIVSRKRGGYCYELNGLFKWLLTELGYDAHLIAATVQRPTGEWAKADTHAAIHVLLEEPYLVDVGFGDSTCLPIPMNGEERTDISGTYRVNRQNNHTFELERDEDSGSRTLYRFGLTPKSLTDFHEGCVFNQVAKDSTFTHSDIVTRATPLGRVTLNNETITLTENNIRTKTVLSEEEKICTLSDTFGIRL
ncbi:arylamine N-acetyltransferase [Sporosarcina sp. JAI121]|uniref:arylamine N-acetyltransferase family protein n=1 Tax=Sporosarcina sp. JAI121 TaxID=2723064 RepID=UPI0015CC74B1|nr:arylamine N-acetyltransferase [Sporosarcina sp. JAI121]NYF24758.1 N-hydroxyarylamine O-acetyltransferase [Sporosarcina sp. JAI121]